MNSHGIEIDVGGVARDLLAAMKPEELSAARAGRMSARLLGSLEAQLRSRFARVGAEQLGLTTKDFASLEKYVDEELLTTALQAVSAEVFRLAQV